jgi:hypothetical protein
VEVGNGDGLGRDRDDAQRLDKLVRERKVST